MSDMKFGFLIECCGFELCFCNVMLSVREWFVLDFVCVCFIGSDLVGFEFFGFDDYMWLFFLVGFVGFVEELCVLFSWEYMFLVWGEDWFDVEFVVYGD